MIEKKDLNFLKDLIVKNLKAEFNAVHLSKNLINTIKVSETENEIKIHIPAEIYNIWFYTKTKIVLKSYGGSYASVLDTKGSEFYIGKRLVAPHNHKGYIDRVIMKSLKEWEGIVLNPNDSMKIDFK